MLNTCFLFCTGKLTMTKTNVSSSRGAPFSQSAGLATSEPWRMLGIEFEALMARAGHIVLEIPHQMNIQDLCSKSEGKPFPFFCRGGFICCLMSEMGCSWGADGHSPGVSALALDSVSEGYLLSHPCPCPQLQLLGQWRRWLRMGGWWSRGWAVSRGSRTPVHIPSSHDFSLIKHQFKEKTTKNFKTLATVT